MKNISFPIAFVICLLFAACRPDPLIITLPEDPPQVVVFSQLIPNQVITILLTKTISSLEFSEEDGDELNNGLVNSLLVENAQVSITFEGRREELFQIAPGVYSSVTTPQKAGIDYHLEIITEEGDLITSTSRMLDKVGFESITPVIERTASDTLLTLEFDLNDPAGENYYMVNFYKRLTRSDIDTSGLDINSFFSRGLNLQTSTLLLSDQTFENSMYSDVIELPQYSPTDSIIVTISNINEEYYRFLDLRRRSGNLLSQVTKEPISYPTNIEGGLGFFNTHFPDVAVFDLGEW